LDSDRWHQTQAKEHVSEMNDGKEVHSKFYY